MIVVKVSSVVKIAQVVKAVTVWTALTVVKVVTGRVAFWLNFDAKNYQAQLFYVLQFPLRYLKMAPKQSKVQKTPKNDQNHLGTFRRSYIRTKASEKFLF